MAVVGLAVSFSRLVLNIISTLLLTGNGEDEDEDDDDDDDSFFLISYTFLLASCVSEIELAIDAFKRWVALKQTEDRRRWKKIKKESTENATKKRSKNTEEKLLVDGGGAREAGCSCIRDRAGSQWY